MDVGLFVDAAIGIACLMAVFSIAATAIQEALAQWLADRPKTLRQGVEALLKSDVVATLERRLAEARGEPPDESRLATARAVTADDLYGADSIKALMNGGRMPSAIPPRVFAETVLDLIGKREELAREAAQEVRDQGRRAAQTVGGIVDALGYRRDEGLPVSVLETAERIASRIETGKTLLDREIEVLETQFNDTMSRVTGWYARLAQLRLLIIGFVLAMGANVDLLGYVHMLATQESSRVAAVALAADLQNQGGEELAAIRKDFEQGLGQLGAPMGWRCRPTDPGAVLSWEIPVCGEAKDAAGRPLVLPIPGPATWAGWVLMGFGAMLGAQFWFDLLKRLMTVRETAARLRRPERTPPAAG